jgi:fructokinase
MILCCGEALIDFLPRRTESGADCYQHVNGGSVYNTAIALGRLGSRAGLLCGISTDFFGDMLMAGLAASKVDLTHCRRKDKSTTLAFVKLTDGHARYSFVDADSALRNLVKADLPKSLAGFEALHFGSISLITEPCGGTYEALLMKAAKTKVVSLDPNIRAGLIKDKRKHLARLNRLIAKADIVKISDEDTLWMTGKKDLAAAARKWLKAGAKIIAITKGGDGVEVYTKRFNFAASAPKVKVADTVGAGDTFTAGFLHDLSSHGQLTKSALSTIDETALRRAANFAMKAAAVTVSRVGADPPWAKEMA